MVQEKEGEMKMILERLKEIENRYNNYVNSHRMDRSYKGGDKVYLWVRIWNSSIEFGKETKFSSWYILPFNITGSLGLIAYHDTLSISLDCMHDIFLMFAFHHYFR